MIPKVIHYCWFGNKPYPELTKRCIENWKRILPDYEFVLWDERNSPMKEPVVQQAYSSKNWAFVSDYVRLHALKENGGIYLDTDVELIKNFETLLSQKCFMGFSQREYVNNAVMGGIQGFHFFDDALQFMKKEHKDGKEQLTSPRVVTSVLRTYGLKDYGEQTVSEVHILPKEAFYPYNPFDPETPGATFFYEDVKPNTFAVHHYMASWNKPGIKQTVIKKIKGLLK